MIVSGRGPIVCLELTMHYCGHTAIGGPSVDVNKVHYVIRASQSDRLFRSHVKLSVMTSAGWRRLAEWKRDTERLNYRTARACSDARRVIANGVSWPSKSPIVTGIRWHYRLLTNDKRDECDDVKSVPGIQVRHTPDALWFIAILWLNTSMNFSSI